MKPTIQAVKGTREFYPEDMAKRQWLYQKIRQVSESFGYQEYDGPFIEKIDLYAAKSGEELVKEQAFVFPDRGGDLITLRPELTLSLARMIAQRQGELVYPVRWWSFGPFWRYEKPQKGRSREFFQWNVDQVGVSSPEADAEMVAICASFFKACGITSEQVRISINHRKLMDEQVAALGVSEEARKQVFHLIDRRDKMRPQEWNDYVLGAGFTEEQLNHLIELLADKELWRKSEEITKIFNALEKMGVAEYVRYDPQIIRGLDYYTGVVFEAWDVGGDGRAVLGGGHYDNLVADVGGTPLPGVGFAMGDMMITLILEKYGKIPAYTALSETVLVTAFDEERMKTSLEVAAALRQAGIKAICYTEPAKLPKQLKYADRLGINVALVIGPDEEATGSVTVKDLKNHTQQIVSKEKVIEVVTQCLA